MLIFKGARQSELCRVICVIFGCYVTDGAQLLHVVLYLMGGPHKGIECIFRVFVGYVYLVLELGKSGKSALEGVFLVVQKFH